MIRWIARLADLLATERAIWRARHEPVTLEFMNAAARAAIDRFPDEHFAQEAKAMSELSLRSVLGQRRHDA